MNSGAERPVPAADGLAPEDGEQVPASARSFAIPRGTATEAIRFPATIRLEAAAVRAVALLLKWIPASGAAALGSLTGAVYGRLARKRYRIARANLQRALGASLSDRRLEAIARRVFRHFGRAAFEMLTMHRYRAPEIGRLFTYEGLEHIRGAYAQGRGVFLFSAHYGNWELVALMQGYMGMPLAMITRPLDNPLLESFMRERRVVSGNRVIAKRSAVRHALRAIREGLGVAIVIDQNVRSGARVFVDFFGQPASTTPTLALLALKTGAPVIPVFSFPGAGGSYHIVYGEEVKVERSGDRSQDVRALTQACTKIIEDQVRERPDCWLWMHERWKTQPRGQEWPAGDAPSLEETDMI